MAEATRPSGSAAVKAARKKKIRQLEASLFGGGNGSDDVTTGLPELQRVGEYRDKIQCTLVIIAKIFTKKLKKALKRLYHNFNELVGLFK